MSNKHHQGPPHLMVIPEQVQHANRSTTTGFTPTVRNVAIPQPLRTLHATALPFNYPQKFTSISTFSADILPMHLTTEVKICHYEKGPYFFFVQLIDKLDDLTNMMINIQQDTFEPLTDTPILGMAVLAVFSENNSKYRAVITGIREESCDVLFVDYGNKANVPYRDLFKIKPSFLFYKTFAISFRLSGLHNLVNGESQSMLEAFEHFTDNRYLFMKVVALEGAPLSQYCVMHNDHGLSILDLLSKHDKDMNEAMCNLAQPPRQIHRKAIHLAASGNPQATQTSTPVITRNDKDPRLVVNQRNINFNEPPPSVDLSIVQNSTTLSPSSAKESSHYINTDRANESHSSWRNSKGSENVNWDSKNSTQSQHQQKRSEKSHQNNDPMEFSAQKSNWDSTCKSSVSSATPQSSFRKAPAKDPPIHKSPDSGHSSSNECLDQVPGKFSRPYIGKDAYDVDFSQWNSPHDFYINLKRLAAELRTMKSDIKSHYEHQRPVGRNVVLKAGDMIIVRESGIYHRAKVLAYNAKVDKVKVITVDVGKVLYLGRSEVYAIDKCFTSTPAMAIKCSFGPSIICCEFYSKIADYIANLVNSKPSLMKCMFSNERHDPATAQNMYFVEISIDNHDLISMLMKAKIIAKVPEELNLARLVQQNLKVMIDSIENLGSFLIRLEGLPITFLAAYVDYVKVKKDQQKMTRIKNMYEKKFCTAKVEAITVNNVLSLSLFIEPLANESAPETYVPITQSIFSAYSVHFERPEVCYMRMPTWDQITTDLLNDMFEFYNNNNGKELDTYKLNSAVAALSTDENWHRGRIVSNDIQDKDDVEILFLDYGNRENVKKTNLRQLDEKYQVHSWLAIKVLLPMVPKVGVDVDQSCIKDLIEKHFKVSVKDYFEDNWIVELEDANTQTNVIDTLVNNNKVDRQDMQDLRGNLTMQRMNNSTISSLEAESLRTSQVMLVVDEEKLDSTKKLVGELWGRISHINGLNDFYLQHEENFVAVELLNRNLAIVASSFQPLTNFRVGQLCVAFCTMSQSWNRAKIIDSDGKTISIEFLDSGITDTTTNKDYLKVLTGELSDIENYAIRCAVPFKLKKSGEEVTVEILKKLKERVCFSFIAKGEKINYVKLFFINDFGQREDITKYLIRADFGHPLEVVESGQKCFISHINSIEDFYVQMEQDSSNLEAVTNLISQGEKSEILDFSTGLICAALYTEDNAWYRAKIIDFRDKEFEVHFIDFGNRCWTSQIAEISQLPIFEIPNYARHCMLKKPSNIASWSEEAEKKFIELAAAGETTFVVNMKKPDEKVQVELFINDESVQKMLSELCPTLPDHRFEDSESTMDSSSMYKPIAAIETTMSEGTTTAYVTHANGPLDFYVNYEKDTADINKVLQFMEEQSEQTMDPLDSIVLGKVCAAKFPEDDRFYRAIILEIRDAEYFVHYIDFGNRSWSKDLRKLPEEFEEIAGFAIHCELKSTNDKRDNMAVKEFQAIVQDNTEPFTVKTEMETEGKMLVEMYRNVAGILIDVADILPQKVNSEKDLVSLATDTYVSGLLEKAAALAQTVDNKL